MAADGPPFGPGTRFSMVSDDFHMWVYQSSTFPALVRLFHLCCWSMNDINHAEFVGGRSEIAEKLGIDRDSTVSELITEGIKQGLFDKGSSSKCVIVYHGHVKIKGRGADCGHHRLGRYEQRQRKVRSDRKATNTNRTTENKTVQRRQRAVEISSELAMARNSTESPTECW